jgi:hypothetical protein
MSWIVGYCGAQWTGGAFPSEAKTAEEAAAEVYAHASSGFPKGDKIVASRLTCTEPFGLYHLDLVGDDPTKPEAWKVNVKESFVPPKVKLR